MPACALVALTACAPLGGAVEAFASRYPIHPPYSSARAHSRYAQKRDPDHPHHKAAG